MTPGRRVVRDTTRRCVIGPGSSVAGADEVETTKTTTALASSRMIRREAIPVVSSRHGGYTTPRTGDSAELGLLRALGCVRRLALVQSAGQRQADRARLGRLL